MSFLPLYLNLFYLSIFEIPFLPVIQFGSSMGITKGDPIRNNLRCLVETTGKHHSLPLFENLSGCEDADTGALLPPEGEPIPGYPDDLI